MPATDVHTQALELRASFKKNTTRGIEWRLSQLKAMQSLLHNERSTLCDALRADLGKCEMESYATEVNQVEHECQHMIDNLRDFMAPKSHATNLLNIPGWSRMYKDPLGCVLVIGAWNYPVNLSLMPLVGAIAAGNCVMVKVPSDKYTSHASRVLAELAAQYLDTDCIKFVEGDRHATTAVLEETWDLIFFTGGSMVGKLVAQAAARDLTPTVLELGGKSPCIVDRSCDTLTAARRAGWGGFALNSGQTCVRPDYLLVHEDVADQFVAQLKQRVKDMFGHDPQHSDLGRIVNQRAHQRLAGLLEQDKKYISFGGNADEDDRYIEPTLLDFGTDFAAFNASASMADEIFGPILPMYRYKSLDEVINYVQEHEKPLGVYLFATDPQVYTRVLRETSGGGCSVNDVVLHMANPNLPFGGVGKSGMGRYHGHYSFDTFSHSKPVLFKTNSSLLDRIPPYHARYPPYTPGKARLINVIQHAWPAWQLRLLGWAFKFGALAVLLSCASARKETLRGWLLQIAGMLE